MNTTIKQLSIAILTLALAVTTTFASNNRFSETDFQQDQYENNFNIGGIPQSVLSANFRHWQPPNPVPLIPRNINDLMMTNGRVIFYNPYRIRQVPPKITAFILAHEYGHIYGRTSNEAQSDRFAAQVYARTDISVVKAAIWHMHNMQGQQCSPTHGCGWQRAINIAKAAGFSEAQYRDIIRGNF